MKFWEDHARLSQRLEPWLNRQMSNRRAGLKLGAWRASPGGFSNITLMSEVLSDESPPQPIVLRLAADEASVFPETDLKRQYRVMHALQGSALPIPRLLGFEEDPEIIGGEFYIMERVTGTVPNENPQYHVSGWFHDLPGDDQAACWMAGVDALGATASLDWKSRGLDFLQDPSLTPLKAQLAYYSRVLEWAESLSRPYPHLREGLAWLKAHQPPEREPSLSWGDAKMGNCVFDGRRLAAMLDWEQATLADGVDDLAWWLMLDECLSAGTGATRLPGLPTREATIARWEAAAGRRAENLQYYEVFAAWRMACIMARIGTLFTARGWVPAEMQMDVNNGGATLLARHGQRLGFWRTASQVDADTLGKLI